MKNYKNIIILALFLSCIYLYLNKDVVDKIVEKTNVKTEIVEKKDTIYRTVFGKSKIKYISKVHDSIVYVASPDTLSEKVNEYNEVINGENSIANVTILTTGELKGLFGTITSQNEIKTIETKKTVFVRKSNIYIGGMFVKLKDNDIDFIVTADYAIKNKVLLGLGYSPFNKSIGVRVGIKVF